MPASRTIGVDLDGVLGNQVVGVLSRENARLGLDLTYEQIVHWDLPFGDTTFGKAIATAMLDRSYVMEMPVHEGAREMLVALREHYEVKILTVRPRQAVAWTKEWLAANELPHDELISAREELKSKHGADALIDDYPRNIREFLAESDGAAIIVDQPWNQDLGDLGHLVGTPRLSRVSNLAGVPRLLAEILA